MRSPCTAVVAILALLCAASPARAMVDFWKEIGEGSAGCMQVREKFKELRAKYPEYHFAFAARRARTVTGFQGCGYAWDTNRSLANSQAMKNCRTWEEKLGTGNGRYVCEFLDQ